jgi:hypothetical protein
MRPQTRHRPTLPRRHWLARHQLAPHRLKPLQPPQLALLAQRKEAHQRLLARCQRQV